MSWPHGDGDDRLPPTDSPDAFSDSAVYNPDRPTSLHQIATLGPDGRLVSVTEEQAQTSLRLMSMRFDDLPQLPFFAPWFGLTTSWHRSEVGKALGQLSVVAGRPLDPTEADLIAYYRSVACRRQTWASPLVAFGTAYMTYRGRDTFRFPFYTPKASWFNPMSFPGRTRSIAKGTPAVMIWHALRFTAYYTILKTFVAPFVHSYALTSFAASVTFDKRLQAVRNRENRNKQNILFPSTRESTQASGAAGSAAPSSRWGATSQQPPQTTSPWAEPPPGQDAPHQDIPPQQDPQGFGDDYVFDDASPVSPAQRAPVRRPPLGVQQQQQQQQPENDDGLSAWERIRRQAKAEEGAPWNPPPQQRGVPRVQQQKQQESYVVDSAEAEKAYAREQAQKEFDEMLERERRAASGEEGSRK
jgi:hypothetical protein